MEVEIQVPDEVPVMTLPNLAFFPQALLPLHIFEPRYRRMLRDVLATNRIFAVAGLDPAAALTEANFEPPHRVACIGLVRACQKNDDGTSNLLLQGLCRISIEAILGDEPYRRIRIRALTSEPGAEPGENARLRKELSRLIKLKLRLTPGGAEGMTELLKTVEDPEVFADIAAFNLCDDAPVKQRLLETLDVNRRLNLLVRVLRSEIDAAVLHQKLQGGLPDDKIQLN
ncbi:MAG TPA: LON peptidase substrate-binding domain-containing protein [Opitutaceae bacterium]